MDIFAQLKTGILTDSPEATELIARAVAQALPQNCTLALHGDLGAGKTTFVRGLARQWGICGHITSPSFNIYNIHEGTRQLVHVDAYRLESAADFEALMLDEFLRPPYCLAVEWPEKITGALSADALCLEFSIREDKHLLKLAD